MKIVAEIVLQHHRITLPIFQQLVAQDNLEHKRLKYIPGMPYGQGQELMAQQTSAPMSGAPEGPIFGKQLGSLLDPTNNPSEPVTAGVDMGPGPGSEILPKNISADTRLDENKMVVQKYLPTLLQAANLPDTPDSYKRFINYLLEQQ